MPTVINAPATLVADLRSLMDMVTDTAKVKDALDAFANAQATLQSLADSVEAREVAVKEAEAAAVVLNAKAQNAYDAAARLEADSKEKNAAIDKRLKAILAAAAE